MTKTIVEMKFGSVLYGTNTPASDTDFKAVHVPDGRAIVLHRFSDTLTRNTKSNNAEKNTTGDVDQESYTLGKFTKLLTEGQTVAMDMLFCPRDMYLGVPNWVWLTIQNNKHKFLTSKAASFVGYVKTQSNKYGIKGSRMATARAAVEMLTSAMARLGTTAKLQDINGLLEGFVKCHDHASIDVLPSGHGDDKTILCFNVCGRKTQYPGSIKIAKECYERLFAEYGKRALQAETNQGIDWKALSHAVRVGRECIELLTTGHITFPRPE